MHTLPLKMDKFYYILQKEGKRIDIDATLKKLKMISYRPVIVLTPYLWYLPQKYCKSK